MISRLLDVHPIYGAIYKDGEFVQRGAVLGLSPDARDVVIAPVSGWVRVLPVAHEFAPQLNGHGLRIEILEAFAPAEFAHAD